MSMGGAQRELRHIIMATGKTNLSNVALTALGYRNHKILE